MGKSKPRSILFTPPWRGLLDEIRFNFLFFLKGNEKKPQNITQEESFWKKSTTLHPYTLTHQVPRLQKKIKIK